MTDPIVILRVEAMIRKSRVLLIAGLGAAAVGACLCIWFVLVLTSTGSIRVALIPGLLTVFAFHFATHLERRSRRLLDVAGKIMMEQERDYLQ